MTVSGTLFTVSAPSGAGKTSLVKALVESTPSIHVSVSHTTRQKRPGEEDGVNYHFVDQASFSVMLEQGDFLEHAQVFENYYGTSAPWVQETLNRGIDVILEIDWQGAAQIRRLAPATQGIFILPPSMNSLSQRLNHRGQDSDEIINKRIAEAQLEISHYVEANFVVVNDSFDDALEELRAIIICQRLALTKQQHRLSGMLQDLLS